MKKLVIPILIILTVVLSTTAFYIIKIKNTEDLAAKVYGVAISNAQLDSEAARQLEFIKINNQSPPSAEAVKSDTLTQLIDKEIINHYATENNISVTDEEVDTLYKQRVTLKGSEAELLKSIESMYKLDKPDYLEVLRYDLLREKVQNNVGKPLSDWLQAERNSKYVMIY